MENLAKQCKYQKLLLRIEGCITKTEHSAKVNQELLDKMEQSYALGAYTDLGYATRKTILRRTQRERYQCLAELHEHRADVLGLLHRLDRA